MMQNMVHPQEQLPIEEITSPLGAQLLEFCESELFPEMQNSEVASSSNCCNYEEHSSYNPTNLNITADMNNYNNNNNTVDNNNDNNNIKPLITANSAPTNGGPSLIFDQSENDISASIDFNTSSFSIPHNQYLNNNNNNNNHDQFNISSLNTQLPLDGSSSLHMNHHQYIPKLGPPMPTGFEDECGLPSMPSYLRMRTTTSSPSCALMDPNIAPYLPSVGMNVPFSAESSGIFTGNGLMLGNGIPHQELEFQGDNGGLFLPDSMQRVFNCSSELQALSSESQHLVHGGGAGNTPLASEITSLEDPTFKVGKLSVEERKRKIHRYMKKRNERNFSKKIKYACRKTLADSRPRVRGRFAKNDEQGEINARTNEYDTDEDVSLYSNQLPDNQSKVVVKEEEDLDSSDIFAHISGVNSFKCSYPIQSWI